MYPHSDKKDGSPADRPESDEDVIERSSIVLQLSLDILESLALSGWTLVPALPSDEMIAAGLAKGGRDPEQVTAIYTAMIKAAS